MTPVIMSSTSHPNCGNSVVFKFKTLDEVKQTLAKVIYQLYGDEAHIEGTEIKIPKLIGNKTVIDTKSMDVSWAEYSDCVYLAFKVVASYGDANLTEVAIVDHLNMILESK